MDFASFIDRVGSDLRHFLGELYPASILRQPSRFVAALELVATDDDICFDGTFAFLGSGNVVPTQFAFTIPFSTMRIHSAPATLIIAGSQELYGEMVTSGEGYEFMASDQDSAIHLHLHFVSDHAFRIGGMLRFTKEYFAFSASPSTDGPASAEALVRPLP